MKKVLMWAGLIAAVLVALYVRDVLDRRAAAESVQRDPETAVGSFMSTMAKLTQLVYGESRHEELEEQVDELEAKGEEVTEKEVADLCEKYGLESQAPLFRKEKTGKAIMAAFLVMRFEEFEVTGCDIEGETARVDVKFTPLDILGLKALTEKMGVPADERGPEPMRVSFDMEKHRHRWYITDMKGDLGKLSRAFGKR